MNRFMQQVFMYEVFGRFFPTSGNMFRGLNGRTPVRKKELSPVEIYIKKEAKRKAIAKAEAKRERRRKRNLHHKAFCNTVNKHKSLSAR